MLASPRSILGYNIIAVSSPITTSRISAMSRNSFGSIASQQNGSVGEASSAELTHLLCRLQDTVLHPTAERERLLRRSPYERSKLAAVRILRKQMTKRNKWLIAFTDRICNMLLQLCQSWSRTRRESGLRLDAWKRKAFSTPSETC